MTMFDPRNERRAAVYAAQNPQPDVEMGAGVSRPDRRPYYGEFPWSGLAPMGTGVSRPDRQPCGYGVPREQCHIGCGYICRRGEVPVPYRSR